jgi:hypothetical protein
MAEKALTAVSQEAYMVRTINLNELWLKNEAVVKAEGAVSGVPLRAPFNDAGLKHGFLRHR